MQTTHKLKKVHRSMLNDHFRAKKIIHNTTKDGEFLYFDVTSTVEEQLKNHCNKIGIKLTTKDT